MSNVFWYLGVIAIPRTVFLIRFTGFGGIVDVFETIAFAAPCTEICLALVLARAVRIEPLDLPIANKWMVATNHEPQSASKFSCFLGIVDVPTIPRHGWPYAVGLRKSSEVKHRQPMLVQCLIETAVRPYQMRPMERTSISPTPWISAILASKASARPSPSFILT